MKRFFVLFVLCTSSLAFARPPDGATAKLDHVVASVDGRPIWHSEIEEIFERNKLDKPTFDQTQMAIDALIDNALVENTAHRLHIDVSDSELAQAEAMIKQQNNLDDAALDKALADQHFTRAQYRRELARQIRMQKTFNTDAAPVHPQITDAEVQKRYDEIKKANPSVPAFDTVKETVREQMLNEKAGAAQTAWLAKLRATAHVERSR
jgi:parvulin-like peptidyl-prolyl isomerase